MRDTITSINSAVNGVVWGPRRAAGRWAGCWQSCIERRLCGRDSAPMWSAFETCQKEEGAQEAAEAQLDKAANE